MARVVDIEKIPLDREKTKEERREEGIRDWCDFYRQNPHLCISSHFQCTTLVWWQDLIIYLMFYSSVFFAIMTRGIGKSFLVGWFLIVWCTIFPRSRIVIASGTRGQARLIVTQKILGEIYNKYPKVRQEIDIKNSSVSTNDTHVKFWNGSEIVVITGGDSSRGNRCCIAIYEEARTLEQDTMKNVIAKMKNNGERQPRYKNDPRYSEYKPENEKKKDIYISSGWFETHHLYNMCMDARDAMFDESRWGERQFALSLPWTFPTIYGFMDYQDDILKEKNASDYSEMWWQIENCGMFWSESEKSAFGYRQLENIRKVGDVMYPIPNEMYTDKRQIRDFRKRFPITKGKNTIRVVSIDIAVCGGDNDNTIMTVADLDVKGNRYERTFRYMEHHNNTHSEMQAIRAKQLFEDFDADLIIMDINGNGMGVFDAGSKPQYDASRDKTYNAWTCKNKDDMTDRVFGVEAEDADPIIYGVKQDAKFNHFMITWTKGAVETGRMFMPLNSKIAEDVIEDKFGDETGKVDEHIKVKYLAPYLQFDITVKEMTALEIVTHKKSPYLAVDNPTLRKDRWTTIGFINYYASLLEQDLQKPKKKKSSFSMRYSAPDYFA